MTIENGSRAEECIQPTIGSSETTRESPLSSFSIAPSIAGNANYSFDFDDFLLHHLPTHKKGVDIGFLEWLVGFVEGNMPKRPKGVVQDPYRPGIWNGTRIRR